jgi:AbrB family looped-hinge helix DNA binding protein
MSTAKLSSKNQVVIPREARQALKVRSGDELLFVVRREHVIVMKRPKSYAAALRGLAGDMFPADYLEKERQSWE